MAPIERVQHCVAWLLLCALMTEEGCNAVVAAFQATTCSRCRWSFSADDVQRSRVMLSSSTPTSRLTCFLFFRERQQSIEDKLVLANWQEQLSSDNLCLPWKTTATKTSNSETAEIGGGGSSSDHLIVRLVEWSDIPALTDMCVQEYSSKPSTLEKLVDRWSLACLVAISTALKIVMNTAPLKKIQNPPVLNGITIDDHAVIVLTKSTQLQQCGDDNNRDIYELIGMIEVSRQPVLPDRIPPPWPLPLWLKQLYCRWNATTKANGERNDSVDNSYMIDLQGWITNLLVAPRYRGRGYSKLLVSACEGVAKSPLWKCRSIHLHCDADPVHGKVAQRLYEGLGYQPAASLMMRRLMMMNHNNDSHQLLRQSASTNLSWMAMSGPDTLLCSSVVVIDDVPLLHLQKDLDYR